MALRWAKARMLPFAAVDVRDRQASAEDGGDEAGLLGLADAGVEKIDGPAVALLVGGDEILGRLAGDAKLLGQTEGALAVDDAEIDGLGLAPHLRSDHLREQAEDLAGGAGMDVFVVGKGVAEDLIPGQVGQHAQLDLGIVGREDHMSRRCDEGMPDRRPSSVRIGNVLQVRVG